MSLNRSFGKSRLYYGIPLIVISLISLFTLISVETNLEHPVADPDINTPKYFSPLFAANNGTKPENNQTGPTYGKNDTAPKGYQLNNQTEWKTPNNISNEVQQNNARNIELNETPNQLQITSHKRQTNESSTEKLDKIDINLKYTKSQFDLFFKYFSDAEDGTAQNILHVKFNQLIEYQDENLNGVYDGEDQAFQAIQLQDFYLANMSQIVIDAEHNLYFFQINSTNNMFNLYFYIAEQFLDWNSGILAPNQIKFDFEILDFPFLSNETRLALDVQFIGNQQYRKQEMTEDEENGFSTNETSIIIQENQTNSYFSWANFAYIDGNWTQVEMNAGNENGNGKTYYLNFEQGAYIYHDPKLGIAEILVLTPPSPPPIIPIDWNNPVFVLIVIGGVVIIAFGLMMTKQEYRHYLLNRVIPLHTAPHRLSMLEVLENETRIKTLNAIIDDPGIHYSKLLETIETSPSNLAWHLDILEAYKIIQKQRIGNFLIFYPYLDKNPFANMDPSLVKSKTTMEIFQLIGDNPGIHVNKIALRLDLHRKTIKYHLDKLNDAGLVEMQKEGRKNTYFVDHDILVR